MSRGNSTPVAAKDIGALGTLGPLHRVGNYPLIIVCQVKDGLGNNTLWVNPSHYRGSAYGDLWQTAFPAEKIPNGYEVKPLCSPEVAQRDGHALVRLGLVAIGGSGARFDGKYLITGVSHKYTHEGDGGGGYTARSDRRFRY